MQNIIEIMKADPKRFVVIGVVAVGVGVGTYFLAGFVKDKIDERNAVNIDDEIEDDEEESWPDIPEGVNVIYSDSIAEIEYEKPELVDYTSYSNLSKKYSGTNPAKTLEDEEESSFEIISEKEYLDASNGMTKCDGTYFTSDQILAGWNDDLVTRDIPTTVGWKAIRMFDDPSVKSVYVRNSELAIDFEIVRSDDPYAEAVTESAEE